ncbi:MAG: hypothetical protein JWL59_2566 [Chthoniobacteraceae bacterium]|nr:hypothetical protein [Chthoniobacteraceae bacterium]
MRKTGILLLTAFALATLPQKGFADSVTLKSGEKLEGKITKETDTEITLEQKISAGITDSRVVLKAEVAKVDKEQPDEATWQTLKNSKLGANSLPPATYEGVLRSIEGFKSAFPASTHLADAQKIASDFEQEKKRVDAGEVKLNGAWLSKEDAEKERYQISALLAFNYMKDQSTGGDLVGALNTFDAIEKQFPGARIWPDAVELARRIATSLKAEVERRQPMVATEVADRAKGLQLASITQRAEMEAAVKRDAAAADAALAAAEKRGLRWPPLLVHEPKSLNALQGKLASELPRLNTIDIPRIRQSLQLSEKAQKAIADKDFEGATVALGKSRELWSANEVVERLNPIAEAGKTAAPAVVEAAPVEEAKPVETAAAPVAEEKAPEVTTASETSEVEERSFLTTPVGIIILIAVIVGIIAAVSAVRKRKALSEEADE